MKIPECFVSWCHNTKMAHLDEVGVSFNRYSPLFEMAHLYEVGVSFNRLSHLFQMAHLDEVDVSFNR